MKKISFLLALFASIFVLSSCTEDYNADVAPPQAWEQEELATAPKLVLTPSAAINLEEVSEASVRLVTSSVNDLPDGAALSPLSLKVWATGSDEQFALENNFGEVLVEDLQEAIEKCYDRNVVARELQVMATQTASVGGESVYMMSEATSVTVTPLEPYNPGFYYLVGGVQGWGINNKSIVMMPVAGEEGKFTITSDFSRGGTNDPNFKISLGTNEGSWDELYGSFVDGSTDLMGDLVNEKAGAIMCPTKEIYTLDIDMLALKYSLTLAADQAPASYKSIGLVGAFSDWGNAMADAALEQVAPHLWAYEGFVHPAAGELKLRANSDWSTSWGTAITVDQTTSTTLEMNGSNLNLAAGTYNIYFNDITSQMYIIAVQE